MLETQITFRINNLKIRTFEELEVGAIFTLKSDFEKFQDKTPLLIKLAKNKVFYLGCGDTYKDITPDMETYLVHLI